MKKEGIDTESAPVRPRILHLTCLTNDTWHDAWAEITDDSNVAVAQAQGKKTCNLLLGILQKIAEEPQESA